MCPTQQTGNLVVLPKHSSGSTENALVFDRVLESGKTLVFTLLADPFESALVLKFVFTAKIRTEV